MTKKQNCHKPAMRMFTVFVDVQCLFYKNLFSKLKTRYKAHRDIYTYMQTTYLFIIFEGKKKFSGTRTPITHYLQSISLFALFDVLGWV